MPEVNFDSTCIVVGYVCVYSVYTNVNVNVSIGRIV